MTFTSGYMEFDGTDDEITITSNQTSLDFSNEQTILIWMYHTYTSGRRNPYDQAYGGYGTWTHEQGNNINYYYGDAGSNTTPYVGRGSTGTTRSVWNMMATTRDTTQSKWYNNTVLGDTYNHSYGSLTTTTANIRLGNGYAGRWIGNMGPVMLFKRALTQAEITSIFEAHRGRYGV